MDLDVKQKVGQLKQLRYLEGEAALLAGRIAQLDAQIGINRRARWRSRGEAEHRARLIALREKLAQRRDRCLAQMDALCGFIDGIGDSRLRQIMVGRYIDGLTWRGVAASIGERDEQYPRRLHNRFLMRNELPAALAGFREDGQDSQGREDRETARG